jgi:predicted nuclease with RNAse H fold
MCDLELRTLGIRFFPVTLGPMRSLTMRGIALKNVLEANGLEVIETYPGGAQDVWGIPRRRDSEGLRRGLKTWVAGDVDKPKITGHELDAITCAIVAELYSRGEYIALGDPREGLIILPRLTMSLRSQSGHPS